MALTKNTFGGVDLLATVTELDARVTTLEGKHLVVTEESEQPKEAESGNQGSQPGQEG
jgi:hypothetical protein